MRISGIVILLTVAMGLAACGGTPSPLSNAVSALRAGDREAFLAAKAEAKEAMKTARTVAQMRCHEIDPREFRKRAEMAAIDKLDKPSLFERDEDQRLVYALNLVGSGAMVNYNDPWVQGLMNGSGEDFGDRKLCPPMDAKQRADIDAATAEDRSKEAALRNVFGDWIAAKQREYGMAQFESNMKRAANRLTSVGMSAKWPTQVVLKDSDGPKPGENIKAAARAMQEQQELDQRR